MKKCGVCSKYTLKEICCDKKTNVVAPLKFSPEDKYWRQRLKAKEILK